MVRGMGGWITGEGEKTVNIHIGKLFITLIQTQEKKKRYNNVIQP